jgi:hypothetical protein
MCSILWWILYTWEALGCIFSNLSLDSYIGNEGEKERWRKAALHPWTLCQESRGSLCISCKFLAFGGGVVYCTIPDRFWWNRSDRFRWNRSDRFVPRVGTCLGGACICAGGALVCFGGLCSLLEHGFVSDVSSRCPCLRGPRLVFFKWSCSFPFSAFDRLLEFLLFFPFLWLPNVCVVNALIKGEIEDLVWFEDRWMVTSWCDEWLIMLCGLILG